MARLRTRQRAGLQPPGAAQVFPDRPLFRLFALCGFLAAAFASGAAAARPAPLLAMVGNGTTESVAWLDPVSLRPVRDRPAAYVGLHDIPHAFSPDGSLLAVGSGRTGSLVIVDLRRMRRVAKLDTHFFANAVTWLSRSRLVLVESKPPRLEASVLDVGDELRLVKRLALPAAHDLVAFGAVPGAAVLLLAPRDVLGEATVAVITPARVRTVALAEIAAGNRPPDPLEVPSVRRYAYPGLAVDPAGGRAFVVPDDGPIAEVDLSSLAVSYHELARPRQADAIADGGGNLLGEGALREAAWLGSGLIAVSGGDELVEDGPGGKVQHFVNAGLRLLDTATWSERTLDEHVDWFVWTGQFLTGVSSDPRRLTVWTGHGDLRFRRPLNASGVQVAGRFAYLTVDNEYRRHRVRVVDLWSGRTIRTVWVPGWFYPFNRESPESCWC